MWGKRKAERVCTSELGLGKWDVGEDRPEELGEEDREK